MYMLLRQHKPEHIPDFGELKSSPKVSHILSPAYSPDMSQIEYVWDFIGRRLTRTAEEAHSKTETLASSSSHHECHSSGLQSEPVWFIATHGYKVLIFDFFPCKFERLFALLSIIYGINFSSLW